MAPARAAGAFGFPSDDLIVTYYRGGTDSLPDGASRGLRDRATLRSSDRVAILSYASPAHAAEALIRIQDDPKVQSVAPNVTRELLWEPNDESYVEQQSWLTEIAAPSAWNITTGAGASAEAPEPVVVAVIDSGVSPSHPDLVNRLVPGYNAVDGSADTAPTPDGIDAGHGTHVAGIIAAEGNNGVGTAGVAMDVRIMPIKVLDDNSEIDVADVIEGIYWAVDNGADVINLSFGSDQYSQAEREAIQYAYANGVVVVAAGGNTFNKISYPANYDETIAVGAYGAGGNPTAFTSRLSRIDLSAPGESIYSPGWDDFYGDYWDDVFYADFSPVSGTSFSAAMVSGAVALIKATHPGIGVEDIRTLLTTTANDVGDEGRQAGTGAGGLDVEDALRQSIYTAMNGTWSRTDSVVASGAVNRTWLWGNSAFRWEYEPYAEAQRGTRLVYYYDKSRMEVTDPLDDRADPWYVTNGLLVKELITGELQIGDNLFESRGPALVNVAGDPDDDRGPTYAAFAEHLNAPPMRAEDRLVLTIDRDGRLGSAARLAEYGVTSGELIPETEHRVASVFWDYLNSSGVISGPDGVQTGRIFDPWFYATGYPITEAYWAEVKLKGAYTDVLVQCFERRCLTYTPSNDPGWRVEMGNVGQHYYTWRYGDLPDGTASGNTTRRAASLSSFDLAAATLRRLARPFH